jgi:pilus assembly protein TadC
MVFGVTLVDAGIGVLILVALAQYAKVRDKSEKGYNWLAAGGALLLFAGLFVAAPALGNLIGSGIWNGLGNLFQVVGWIFALVGVVFVAYETVIEK